MSSPSTCLPPASVPSASVHGGASALRVLYVEDNPVNTLLMTAMFDRLPGLALRCESDPWAGLAQALSQPPAVLLIDIQMPGMDGIELLRLLRAHPATRHLPAIAVTANALPHDVARGVAAGFAHYLTKPLSLRLLQAALHDVLPAWAPPA
jgi:CheY-like chemotaxis protein